MINTIFSYIHNQVNNGLFIQMCNARLSPVIEEYSKLFKINITDATMYSFKLEEKYTIYLVSCPISCRVTEQVLIDNTPSLILYYPSDIRHPDTNIIDIMKVVHSIYSHIIKFIQVNLFELDILSYIPEIFTIYSISQFYTTELTDFDFYEQRKAFYDNVCQHTIDELFGNMKILQYV